MGELGDLPGHLDAGGPGSDHHEREQVVDVVAAGGAQLGHLEGTEDPAAQLQRVVDALHAGRELGEPVVAEVGLTGARRHDQRVVRRDDVAAEHVRGDRVCLQVDRGDLAEQHLGVLLPAQDLAGRRRDLALGQDAGGDLVEQRLEEVVGGLRDHGHVDVGATERLGAEQASEPGSDHHDLVAPVSRCHGGLLVVEFSFESIVSLPLTGRPIDDRVWCVTLVLPGSTQVSTRGFCAVLVSGGPILGRGSTFAVSPCPLPTVGDLTCRSTDRPSPWGQDRAACRTHAAGSVGTCDDDRSRRPRRVRRDRRLGAGDQRAPARGGADLGPGAWHPRAPPGRGPRRLAAGARAADHRPTCRTKPICCSPSDAGSASSRARADAWGVDARRGRQDRLVRTRGELRRGRRRGGQGHRDPCRGRGGGRRARGRRGGLLDPRYPGARLHRPPPGTTASCAARSGCSPSPTRTTTRWPRTSPTSSAPWTSPRGRRSATQQIEAAYAAGEETTDLRARPCPVGSSRRSTSSSRCSTSPTSSAGPSGCCRWPAPRSERAFQKLVPPRVRPPGRR